MLPTRYPDPQHLPFNHTAMDNFTLMPPDRDPGGEGIWLLMQGTRVAALADAPDLFPLGTRPPEALQPLAKDVLYLGNLENRPCRALQLPEDIELPAEYRYQNLLASEPQLGIAELSLAGLASQALHWHSQSLYCGYCGAPTDFLPGEWGKRCTACGQFRYPGVHPCVIVLIARPGELLLVRKGQWAKKRFSLVAGFVEFGECLEECVAREVREEVGVEIGNIRYAGSQSWPFPNQLMAGFFADYREGELCLDREELDEGGWFPLDNLPDLPPRRSIARWLIDSWCRQQGVTI